MGSARKSEISKAAISLDSVTYTASRSKCAVGVDRPVIGPNILIGHTAAACEVSKRVAAQIPDSDWHAVLVVGSNAVGLCQRGIDRLVSCGGRCGGDGVHPAATRRKAVCTAQPKTQPERQLEKGSTPQIGAAQRAGRCCLTVQYMNVRMQGLPVLPWHQHCRALTGDHQVDSIGACCGAGHCMDSMKWETWLNKCAWWAAHQLCRLTWFNAALNPGPAPQSFLFQKPTKKRRSERCWVHVGQPHAVRHPPDSLLGGLPGPAVTLPVRSTAGGSVIVKPLPVELTPPGVEDLRSTTEVAMTVKQTLKTLTLLEASESGSLSLEKLLDLPNCLHGQASCKLKQLLDGPQYHSKHLSSCTKTKNLQP